MARDQAPAIVAPFLIFGYLPMPTFRCLPFW